MNIKENVKENVKTTIKEDLWILLDYYFYYGNEDLPEDCSRDQVEKDHKNKFPTLIEYGVIGSISSIRECIGLMSKGTKLEQYVDWMVPCAFGYFEGSIKEKDDTLRDFYLKNRPIKLN
jgi:hypothetical protein